MNISIISFNASKEQKFFLRKRLNDAIALRSIFLLMSFYMTGDLSV